MNKLRLQLLGAFRLQSESGEALLFPTKKTKALLAYLALAGDQPHSRSVLANLLWDEANERQARESLRQTLRLIRKTFSPYEIDPLSGEGDAVALDPAALTIDAREFLRLAHSSNADSLARAEELYVGELLEGLNLNAPEFENWLLNTRQLFREKAVDVLSRLLSDGIASGQLERATSVATRLLTLDPLRESGHRALMELHGKQGRYAAALRQYQICAEILARELNVEPEPKTTALYREIRALRNTPRQAESELTGLAQKTKGASQKKLPLERRQVTVLCCEISGLNALSAALDPEELVEIADRCRRHCAQTFARFGGYVETFSGDRLTALFGFPAAHEYSAEEAVRAGLALREEMPKLNPEDRLGVRIGIATSPVITSESGAETFEAAPVTFIGEAPGIANALQAAAPLHGILIAERTKSLIRDLFECVPHTGTSFDGAAASDVSWEVLGPRRGATRFTALHQEKVSTFVGRDQELSELLDLWQKTKDAAGQIAFITGEPGIGKSRLALECRTRIESERHSGIFFQCSPFYADSAFYPFIDELERAAALYEAPGDAGKLDRLEALAASYSSASNDVVPLFAHLLSIQFKGRYPPLALSAAQLRRKTVSALLDRIESFARQDPAFVIIEDCQWADASSLELLNLLADRIRSLPLLLVITARPGFDPVWGGLAHVSEINLDRIVDTDARVLIQQLSGKRALPAGVVDQIAARTDGIPLFLEEMTQAVLETTPLADGENGSKPYTGQEIIPTSLQDLLMDRFDRLGEAKGTAQTAAVIGRDFSEDLLSQVAGTHADRTSEDLKQLVSSGLVVEQPLQSGRVFAFKHALVRDTAYQSILKSRRQQLHAAIADALCNVFPALGENNPELVARHLTDAGMNTAALEYWLQAGISAASASANREAIAHLEHGLELVPSLENATDRRGWERRLLSVLGPAVMAVEGYAAAKSESVLERARELIDEDCPTPERLRVLCGLWGLRAQQGELAAAQPLAEDFLAFAEKSRLGVELGHCMMGINLSTMGEFESAHRHLGQVIESFQAGTQTPNVIFGMDEFVMAHCYLARILFSLGYPEKADQTAERGFALAMQGAGSVPVALAYVARLYLKVQNPQAEDIDKLITDAKAHALDHELPPFQNWFAFWGAAIWLRRGEAAKALPIMQASIANADAAQNWLFRPFQLGCVAEAFRQLGDQERAFAAIENAIDTAAATGERQSDATLCRIKGHVYATFGNLDEAEQAFRTGLDVARRQKARMEELRLALVMIMQTPQIRISPEERLSILADVYETFDEGFEFPDLRAAQMLLGKGPRGGHPRAE